jgi:hypothetical protein
VDAKSLNILSLPLADFIAPADCSSWELRLRQFTALGGTDVAVAPGGGRHLASFSHVDLPFHSTRSCLRDTGASGPGFYIFMSLLRLNRGWTSIPACAVAFSTWISAVDYCWPTAAIGFLYVYDLPLRLRLASTTCFYDLPEWPASLACLYGLPLRPASTVCLHHVITIIIIIIIVHLLFKRNIYLSVLYVIYVFFSSSFPEIIFPFLLLSMQLKNGMLICC